MNFDRYEALLLYVYKNGWRSEDRTGTGVRKLWSLSLELALQEKFPLITSRKVHFKSVVHELLWFLKGDTNIKYLNEHGVTIWDEWADSNGDLGPIYGRQWRHWGSEDLGYIDQISCIVNEITDNPQSRRLVLSSWNVSDLNKMALHPCHVMCQFFVCDDKLRCHVYQRSADLFLGVPYNIASYALLTCMIAKQCNLRPWKLNWTGGDCHIYNNHLEQCKELIGREPRPLPVLGLSDRPKDIFDYRQEDIILYDYDPHPAIPAQVAV